MDQSASMDLQEDKPFYLVKENICKQFNIDPQNLITYPIDPRDDSISVGDIILKNPQILTIINTNIVYLGDEVSEFEPTTIDLTPKQQKKRIIKKQIEAEHSFFSLKKEKGKEKQKKQQKKQKEKEKEKTKTKKNFLKNNNQFLSKTPKPKTRTNTYRKTRPLPNTSVKPQITRISKMTLNKLRPKTEKISRSRTRIKTGSMAMNKKQNPFGFGFLNSSTEIKKPKVNVNKTEKVEKKEAQEQIHRNKEIESENVNVDEDENKNKKIVSQDQPKKQMKRHNVRKFKKIVRQLRAVRSTGNKILDLLLKYQIKNVGQNSKHLEQFHQSFIGHPIVSTQPLSKLLHYSSITKFNRPLLLYLYNNKVDPKTNRVVRLMSDNIFINLINSYYHFWVVDLYKLRLPSYIRKKFEITRYPCFYKVQINKEKIRCQEWKQRSLNKDIFIEWLEEILTKENKTKWNKLKELLGTDFSEYVNEEELDFQNKENLFDDHLNIENMNQTKDDFFNDDIDFDKDDFNLDANKELENENEGDNEHDKEDKNDNLDLVNKKITPIKVQKQIIKEEKTEIIFDDELDLNFDLENSQKPNPMKKLLDLSSLYNDFIHKKRNRNDQFDENQIINDEKNFELSSDEDYDDENLNKVIDNDDGGDDDDEHFNDVIDQVPITTDNLEKKDDDDNNLEFLNENEENIRVNVNENENENEILNEDEDEITNTNKGGKKSEKDNQIENFIENDFEFENVKIIENENVNIIEKEFENDKKIDEDEERNGEDEKDQDVDEIEDGENNEKVNIIENEDEEIGNGNGNINVIGRKFENDKKSDGDEKEFEFEGRNVDKKSEEEEEEEEDQVEKDFYVNNNENTKEIEILNLDNLEDFEQFENEKENLNDNGDGGEEDDAGIDDELIYVTIKVIGQNKRYSKEFKKNDNLLEIINWINDLFPTITEFSIWIRENKKWITPKINEYDLLSELGIENNSLLIIQGSIL
ncbi:histone-lysine n-methyltransferase h3 lysine-79 specific [Anaeramoeba flamelloides]|uniref:Histone-lysine n-methyltransferase h3 lysine-79 specific n=1 Tax=Anaeramoeba flamelloides TaxID=1746091 RepID=A0AAV7Y724_9EUKA|nr:histone-lysine n-methyltransferase h3 lysine-79 specific [Anaeramoeba flamelloides]